MDEPVRVAVLGAGISGLACARRLRERGAEVVVFDKGRAPGGRASSRRIGTHRSRGWDHGAVCAIAEEEDFQREIARWVEAGVVAPWPVAPGVDGSDPAQLPALLAPGTSSSWVGVPSMSAIARHLATELDVRCGKRVTVIAADAGGGWRLRFDDDSAAGGFDRIVLTLPPAQAHPLLEDIAPELAEDLLAAWMLPCWTLLGVTEAVTAPLPIRRAGPGHLPDGVLTLVCEDTKPGREPLDEGTRWTLQADTDWSLAHLEDTPAEAATALGALLATAVNARVLSSTAHRWRYGRVSRPLGLECIVHAELGIALAGDYCRGDGLEHAWLSGRAAGEALPLDG